MAAKTRYVFETSKKLIKELKEHKECALPTAYDKKKSKEISVFADFSTRLNNAQKYYHYSFPIPEEIFVKLSGHFFAKIWFEWCLSPHTCWWGVLEAAVYKHT